MNKKILKRKKLLSIISAGIIVPTVSMSALSCNSKSDDKTNVNIPKIITVTKDQIKKSISFIGKHGSGTPEIGIIEGIEINLNKKWNLKNGEYLDVTIETLDGYVLKEEIEEFKIEVSGLAKKGIKTEEYLSEESFEIKYPIDNISTDGYVKIGDTFQAPEGATLYLVDKNGTDTDETDDILSLFPNGGVSGLMVGDVVTVALALNDENNYELLPGGVRSYYTLEMFNGQDKEQEKVNKEQKRLNNLKSTIQSKIRARSLQDIKTVTPFDKSVAEDYGISFEEFHPSEYIYGYKVDATTREIFISVSSIEYSGIVTDIALKPIVFSVYVPINMDYDLVKEATDKISENYEYQVDPTKSSLLPSSLQSSITLDSLGGIEIKNIISSISGLTSPTIEITNIYTNDFQGWIKGEIKLIYNGRFSMTNFKIAGYKIEANQEQAQLDSEQARVNELKSYNAKIRIEEVQTMNSWTIADIDLMLKLGFTKDYFDFRKYIYECRFDSSNKLEIKISTKNTKLSSIYTTKKIDISAADDDIINLLEIKELIENRADEYIEDVEFTPYDFTYQQVLSLSDLGLDFTTEVTSTNINVSFSVKDILYSDLEINTDITLELNGKTVYIKDYIIKGLKVPTKILDVFNFKPENFEYSGFAIGTGTTDNGIGGAKVKIKNNVNIPNSLFQYASSGSSSFSGVMPQVTTGDVLQVKIIPGYGYEFSDGFNDDIITLTIPSLPTPEEGMENEVNRLNELSSLNPTIRYINEIDSSLPFLDNDAKRYGFDFSDFDIDNFHYEYRVTTYDDDFNRIIITPFFEDPILSDVSVDFVNNGIWFRENSRVLNTNAIINNMEIDSNKISLNIEDPNYLNNPDFSMEIINLSNGNITPINDSDYVGDIVLSAGEYILSMKTTGNNNFLSRNIDNGSDREKFFKFSLGTGATNVLIDDIVGNQILSNVKYDSNSQKIIYDGDVSTITSDFEIKYFDLNSNATTITFDPNKGIDISSIPNFKFLFFISVTNSVTNKISNYIYPIVLEL